MAHDNQRNFCLSIRKSYPKFFHKKFVLDIGSLDINGNNKFLFSSCQYIGVDVSQGANVDIITPAHLLKLPDATFDTIVSTECFEHDRYYQETLTNIVRLLKPGGMFMFTCATTGRPEHGTARTTPGDAPLIQEIEEWRDYYKNLTESDIRDVLDIEDIFHEFEFSVNKHTFDLYFFGVKRGKLLERDNYSFLLDTPLGQFGTINNPSNEFEVCSHTTPNNEAVDNCFLVTSPNQGGGIYLVRQSKCDKISCIPSAGVTLDSNSLYVGFQPQELHAFGVKDFSFSSLELDDIHDLLVFGDALYVVGTTKNIIIKYDLNGQELQRWIFSGEPDSRHVNCLGIFGGKVVFSAFGDFQNTREYKGNTLGNGYIQELESGKRLISGLNQPHSLVEVAGNIVFANSGNFEIAEYDNQGRFVRKKTFDAYVRGLARNENHLAIGLSRARNQDHQTIPSGRLVVLDAKTWEYIYSVDIDSDEIYSVVAISDEAKAKYFSDHLISHSFNSLEKVNTELLRSLLERDRHVSLVMKALRDANTELLRSLISQDWYKSQYSKLIPQGVSPVDHFFELGGIDEGCMPSDNPGLLIEQYISCIRDQFTNQVIATENNCQHKIVTLNDRLTTAEFEFSTTLDSYRTAHESEKERLKSELRSDWAVRANQYEARIQVLEVENARLSGLGEQLANQLLASENSWQHQISAINEKLTSAAFEFSTTLESYRLAHESEKERLKSELYSDWSMRANQYEAEIKALDSENYKLIEETSRLNNFVRDLTCLREKERTELQSLHAEKISWFEGVLDNRLSDLSDFVNAHADQSRSQLENISHTTKLVHQELIDHANEIQCAIHDVGADLKHHICDSTRDIEKNIVLGTQNASAEIGRLTALADSIRQEIIEVYSSRFCRWLIILRRALSSKQENPAINQSPHENYLVSSNANCNLYFERKHSESSHMNNIGYLMSLYNESFVVAVYEHILARSPDSDGLSFYAARLRSGTHRLDVLGDIYYSDEARSLRYQDNAIEHMLSEYKKSKGLAGVLRRLTGQDIRTRLFQIEAHIGRVESLLERISYGRPEGVKVEERRSIPVLSNSPVFNLRPTGGKDVVVLTTPHCSYVADLMVRALEKIAISARVIFEMPHHGYDDVPHIVICPQMFPVLPGFYVAYQMEQSVSSRWFTEDYFKRLENSFAIFDYSLTNIAHLQAEGLSMKQINYLPIGYIPAYKKRVSAVEEYDVLFYGDINNDRRRLYVSEISKRYNVKVINDCFGHELYSEMAKAKIVINVHYYEGALLETTRIFECLSNDKLIVSECSSDMEQHVDLMGVVDFVEVGNVQEMLDRLDYWLSDDSRRLAKIKQNTIFLDKGFNEFEFYFYRFLLATDNIKYDKFWNVIGKYKPLVGSRLCLNLPEAVSRGDGFKADNFYGFEMFPGLRHSLGWVGCALSYKYMIMLAREHGLQRVAICEDDVEFPDDFSEKISSIEKYLDSVEGDWDIFSGLLANLNEEANILAVNDVEGIRFVTVDRLISTVFNIYDARVYDVISSWDPENRDVAANTIDRYLESNSKLKVVTTSPFMVGHKEEEYSTLWGFKNTQYRDLINASSILLKNKVFEFAKDLAA